MDYFIGCFVVALVATLFILRSSMRHARLSADHDLSGPQKFHSRPVPRVGGLGIVVGMAAGAAMVVWNVTAAAQEIWLLLLCGMPAFLTGIAEDLTKKIRPRDRLIATVCSALLAVWLLQGLIQRTDVPVLQSLVSWYPFAVALTVLVVAAVANAVNLIDGFNGLASMCVLLMVLALTYVAFQVGDQFIFIASLITAGATLGFFVWNFPAGLIFLGDGGAYLLGFLLAELGILLVHRNASVSPIFPVLLCAYPIFETIFTVYRRKFIRGVATAEPDGIHLHTLIHRRLIRWTLQNNVERRRLRRKNSMTSPYLWILCLTSVIPSVLWWDNTAVLAMFIIAFMAVYIWLYSRIVRFRSPRWLVFRRTQ